MKRSPIKRKSALKRGKPLSKRKALNKRGKRAKNWSKRLKVEFSQLIRKRDKKCVFSGIVGSKCGGPLQCSHILPVGKYPSIALHPKNACCLCYAHHIIGRDAWHKNPWQAKEWLLGVIGGEWASEIEWLAKDSLTFKAYREEEWRQIWADEGLI